MLAQFTNGKTSVRCERNCSCGWWSCVKKADADQNIAYNGARERFLMGVGVLNLAWILTVDAVWRCTVMSQRRTKKSRVNSDATMSHDSEPKSCHSGVVGSFLAQSIALVGVRGRLAINVTSNRPWPVFAVAVHEMQILLSHSLARVD